MIYVLYYRIFYIILLHILYRLWYSEILFGNDPPRMLFSCEGCNINALEDPQYLSTTYFYIRFLIEERLHYSQGLKSHPVK